MKRVIVEGTPLFRQRSGVGQYTKNLLERTIDLDKSFYYTVFGFLLLGKSKPEQALTPRENLRYKYIRYLPSKVFQILYRKFYAPPIDLLLGEKADIALFPNFARWPLLFTKKTVLIIYDLSYIYFPQYTAVRLRKYLTRSVPKSITKSNHIITISENSKREIVDYYKVDPRKVTIAYPAVDHNSFKPRNSREIQQIAQKYGLKGQYILYTGTIEPRKNIIGLLNAYANMEINLQNRYGLVLVGGKGWLDTEIKDRLNELAGLNITLTGYAPDEDLPGLYSGASLFVYPSFYEGFGMPPLEAMACGVPVITSDNSSLPEVVGDAAILVNAENTQLITQSMESVLSEPALAKKLANAGLIQAKRFDWDDSAEILLGVLKKVEKD